MAELTALRSDLVIKEQTIKKEKSYIVKDPVKQSYYRFEVEEHFVITHMDGHRNANEIAELYNEEFQDELTGKDIHEFLESIKSMDLFEKDLDQQNTFLYEKLKEQRKSRILQAQGSAMYFRVSVWDPDQFFGLIMPYVGWIWSRKFVMLMNLFMLISLLILLNNYKAVQVGLDHIFDFSSHTIGSIFFLWVTVIGTIAIHEVGHGMTCKRFGGECHEIGLLFMFGNPCLYANVNDAWIFDKKEHRLYVTFAGCYTEFLFGFLMMYLWLFTQPGSTVHVFSFQVVIVAFFSAIFMNFNPLMKFDGYFALSDALESPNLRDRSQAYVKYLSHTKIFRLDREFDYVTRKEHWILLIYGTLVIIYMTNVMTGLGFMVGGMMMEMLGKVMGIAVTAWVMYKILGRFFFGTIGFIKVLIMEQKAFFSRKIVRVVGLVIILGVLGILIFFPFPLRFEDKGTLEPLQDMIVRSQASGYVMPFKDPNKVEFSKGEEILRLSNSDLQQKRENQKLDLDINKMNILKAVSEGNTPDLVKLRQTRQKFQEIMLDLDRQHKNLSITAPFDGEFETKLMDLENTYLAEGDEIGRLIDPSSFQAKLDIVERDLENIKVNTSAYFSLAAQPELLFQGEVTEVSTLHKMQGVAHVYQVTVTFPNKEHALRSDLEGTVFLNIGHATVLQRVIRWVQKTIRLDLQL